MYSLCYISPLHVSENCGRSDCKQNQLIVNSLKHAIIACFNEFTSMKLLPGSEREITKIIIHRKLKYLDFVFFALAKKSDCSFTKDNYS